MTTRQASILVSVLLLNGCGSAQSPSLHARGSSSLPVSASQLAGPTATPAGIVEPSQSAAGQLLKGFALNDILRVEVDRLAVRVAPYTDKPLATGWTWDAQALEWTSIGEVRLDAGDFVSVELGPLQIGDITWYRVWPAEGGQLNYSTVNWDTKNNGANGAEAGWVAAAVGPDVYMTLHEAFEFDRSANGLPQPLMVSGIGGYVSEPLENHDLFGLAWVYLIDGKPAPCGFTVTLEPAAGGAGLVSVDQLTNGAFEEGGGGLGSGNRAPVVGEGFEPFELRVESDCEWSLRLEWLAHD
jgi:hypothetical protein